MMKIVRGWVRVGVVVAIFFYIMSAPELPVRLAANLIPREMLIAWACEAAQGHHCGNAELLGSKLGAGIVGASNGDIAIVAMCGRWPDWCRRVGVVPPFPV
ncbi:hypothetical protein SAMN05519103_01767 [Rhizobiales bacterium GAS113]|nr:hypothetical protein SAMN05519103_01767 [Rhizobiales bacterium GAS113]